MREYGPSEIVWADRGMWGNYPVRARGVLCPDGTRRSITLKGDAGVWFALNGSVKVNGKTVTGFVTNVSDADAGEGLEFIPYKYLKNATAFEEV